MALLYDANGREIYPDGVTYDSIRDAIQAAARADEWTTAYEIAERYGWNNICLYCAEAVPTEKFFARYGHWPVCVDCKEVLEPHGDFADVKMYAYGLFKRDVQ